MKKMKRVTALILAAMLTFSTAGYDLQAAELSSENTVQQAVEETTETVEIETTEVETTEIQASETGATEIQTTQIQNTEENKGDSQPIEEPIAEEPITDEGAPASMENSTENSTENNKETVETILESIETDGTEEKGKETKALVNYVMVENPYIQTPGTEKIIMGIGTGNVAIRKATLTYTNTDTGAVFYTDAKEILEGNTVTFQMEFSNEGMKGQYRLTEISYEAEDGIASADLREIGIQAAFGVGKEVNTNPDDVFVEGEEISQEQAAELEVVTIDENGMASGSESLVDAIGNAKAKIPAARGIDATGAGNVVVVLDPGHGGSDGGAQANGLSEKELNFKIASYCKAELEQYSGVTVYMTRTTDTYLTLEQRAEYARSVGANVLVSIHINSGSTTATGAEVYYPNSNYNAVAGATGSGIASKILANLTALGLTNRGTKIRNSANGTQYADGSLADYYGIIRESKERGFAGIIVEHAFVSNASDASNFLNSDAKLQKLGIADATGIAQFYGLKKGSAELSISSVQATDSNSIKIKWNKLDDITGYDIARSTSKNGDYTVVKEITNASTTSWTDTVDAGMTYYYKVRTYKSSGNETTYGKYTDPQKVYTLKAPAVQTVKSKESGKIQITWDKVDEADKYDIYRSTSENDGYGKITTISSGATTTYTDSSLSNNKTYYYKVMATATESGTTYSSSFGAVKGGKCIAKPSITSVVSKDSTSLEITWKKVNGASGYVIYRSNSQNGSYSKIKTIENADTVTYTDTKRTEGKNYYYKVEAYNYNDGTKGYSGRSAVKSGKTLKKTSITTLASSANAIQIKWKKNSDGTGYQIYRSTSKNGTYKKVKTISKNSTTSYKDSGLTGGKTYYYKVRVIGKDGSKTTYASYSSVKSAYVIKKTSIKSVESKTDTSLKITWNKVSGAKKYVVYRSTSKNGSYKKIGTTKSSVVTYTDKKLTTNKTYYYKVEVLGSGLGSDGTSGLCSAKYGKTVDEVTISSIKVTSSSKLKLSWKKADGASGYQIARSDSKDGSYKVVKTITSGKTTSYTDKVPKENKTYYYKIRVYSKVDGDKQYGRYTAVKSMKTYAKPVFTSAEATNSTSITLKWNKVSSANGYIISRSTSENGTYKEIKKISLGATVSYKDKDVKADKKYYYKIQATGKNGVSSSSDTAYAAVLAKGNVSSVNYVADAGMNVTWSTIKYANSYSLYRSTSKTGTYSVIYSGAATSYTDATVEDTNTYYYKVRGIRTTTNGTNKGDFSEVESQTSGYKIMGDTSVTKEQMVALYKWSGRTYPASTYEEKGAATVEDFVDIVLEEAKAEGVKGEVMWAQICLETGFLSFVGDVRKEQCNFGGLGATGGGVTGLTFPDVRTGIRAQVQHMKAYASTDGLNQTCVDPRFTYVSRGCAKYIENLGAGKWAADPDYATKLKSYISRMKTY